MSAAEALAKFQELLAQSKTTTKIIESDRTETGSSGTKFPYITGHCGNGSHEGMKVVSGLGHLLKPCSGIYTWRFTEAKCSCWCHANAIMMRRDAEIAASTAPMVTNATDGMPNLQGMLAATLGPVPTYVTPTESELKVILPPDPLKVLEDLCNSGRVSQQLVNLVIRKAMGKEPTLEQLSVDEGRRKRGQLDTNVELVCRLWLMKYLPWEQLTTSAISLMIDAVDPPSQGAIYSVFMLWAGNNWATIEKHPIRFIKFSDEVWIDGLTVVRYKHKRELDRRAKGFF